MPEGSGKTDSLLVLLGAGASMDAGLPSTFDLTDRLIENLSQRDRQIFFFVIGVMHAEIGRAGGNPSQKVSAERVAAVIEMLAGRESLAIAPFVQQWDPAIATLSAAKRRRPFPNWEFKQGVDDLLKPLWSQLDEQQRFLEKASRGKNLGRFPPSIRSHRDRTNKLWRAIDSMIVDERPDGQDPFAATASSTRLALPGILTVGEDTDLTYLDPIFELHRMTKIEAVVTLNYDLTFETAAARRGIAVARGVEAWSERTSLRFEPGMLRLLKLHGSIDWVRRVSHRDEAEPLADGPTSDSALMGGQAEEQRLRYPREWIDVVSDLRGSNEPDIIFGEGSKLQIEGPFLDLLTQFRAELESVDVVVVIGYSFGDLHINSYVRKWLAARPARRLHVVDPGFGGSSSTDSPGRSSAAIGLSSMGSEVDLRELLLRDSDSAGAQVAFHRVTARSGLKQVLDQFL